VSPSTIRRSPTTPTIGAAAAAPGRELDRFFRDYKVLEGKTSEVDRPYSRAEALDVMRGALAAYRGMSAWKKG
jgi:hypothetical protein